MNNYDVVIVGAGNAGLSAGITMAMAGKKTLIIEQHNLPGGCATSYVRGRFEFDPSLHELCDVGTEENPGDIRNLLKYYGVKVDWYNVRDCFRVITKSSSGVKMDVTIPSGRVAFIDKMEKYVPGSRQSMCELFALMDEVVAGMGCLGGKTSSDFIKVRFPNLLRVGAYSCMDVFRTIGLPDRAIDILSTYWCYLGVDMEKLSFIHYCSMVYRYIVKGAVIPAHTSHEISVAMAERFIELGGEIRYNCRAEEFLFSDRKCCGVRTNDGVITCSFVLANINPEIIYGRMISDKSLVPEREKRLAAARKKNYGARMFTVQMGLNKTPAELGIRDYSIFLPSTADSVEEAASMRRIKTNNFSIFLCYNIANPEFSPKGTCVCSLTTFFGPEDWEGIPQADYAAFKSAVARKLINNLRAKTGIDLLPYIEEIEISTPLTFARYLGTPEGCVYGYLTEDWDSIMARMMSIKEDYPLDGLMHIGASGPRGDGYSSTYICGNLIAKIAIGKMNKLRKRVYFAPDEPEETGMYQNTENAYEAVAAPAEEFDSDGAEGEPVVADITPITDDIDYDNIANELKSAGLVYGVVDENGNIFENEASDEPSAETPVADDSEINEGGNE